MSRRADPGPARALRFIGNLTHTKGEWAGQPFNLRAWQTRAIRQLFATRADGKRQYRTCLFFTPRKNGKTELAAAIALYGLLGDGEQGAEVYSAAADKDQATLVFNVAAQMIRNDAHLLDQCEILDSQKRIVHRKSGSFYKAISAEAYSKHGANVSLCVYDELHAAGSRELFDVLSTSMGARANPLMVITTTAGFDRHSILWEIYAHAKRVLEAPDLDPTFLPILYEAPAEADWTDEKVWKACNPALGDFRSLEDMRILCARAQEIPAQENVFRRLYLNQWTEQATRWVALADWDACRGTATPADLEGRRCFVGLDLSATTDLTALVGAFPRVGGFDVLAQFFVPQDAIRDRSRRDKVPYDQWAREGALTATPGPTVDYEAVRAALATWATRYQVQTVGVDPWNALALIRDLKADGFDVVDVNQRFSGLSAPTKALEKAILGRTLAHDGDPILRWNIANAAAEQDAQGNLKLSKKLSTERIDGAVALVMAIDMMERAGPPAPEPEYQMLIFGGPPAEGRP